MNLSQSQKVFHNFSELASRWQQEVNQKSSGGIILVVENWLRLFWSIAYWTLWYSCSVSHLSVSFPTTAVRNNLQLSWTSKSIQGNRKFSIKQSLMKIKVHYDENRVKLEEMVHVCRLHYLLFVFCKSNCRILIAQRNKYVFCSDCLRSLLQAVLGFKLHCFVGIR